FTDTGSISGVVDGGDSEDMVVGPDTVNDWTLSGLNAGTLNAAAHFVNIENLAGGKASDTFHILPQGSVDGFLDGCLHPDDGTLPIDTLDYSMYGSPVTVDLGEGTATGVAELHGIADLVGSDSAGDFLIGPGQEGDEIEWTIDGANEGEVQGTTFTDF